MNLNKLPIIALCLSSMLLLYTSCKKTENFGSIPNNTLNNQTNTLSLAKIDDLSKTIEQLRNMGDEQLENWEKQKGFVSLRHYQTELLKKIEDKPEFTQTEWNELSKEYADIAYFDEIGRFKPKLTNPAITPLVNRKRRIIHRPFSYIF